MNRCDISLDLPLEMCDFCNAGSIRLQKWPTGFKSSLTSSSSPSLEDGPEMDLRKTFPGNSFAGRRKTRVIQSGTKEGLIWSQLD